MVVGGAWAQQVAVATYSDSASPVHGLANPGAYYGTLAGSQTGAISNPGSIQNAWGVAFDKNGDLYFTDHTSQTIWYAAAGTTTAVKWQILPSGSDPFGIAIDPLYDVDNATSLWLPSKLWVACGASGKVLCFRASGNDGLTNHSVLHTVSVDNPRGLAFDNYRHLYVAECFKNQVTQLNAVNGSKTGIAYSAGLSLPHGLACDYDGNVYAANVGSNTICKISRAGASSIFINGTGLSTPVGIANPPDGTLLVSNAGTGTITRYGPGGALLGTFATGLNNPAAITLCTPTYEQFSYGTRLDVPRNLFGSPGNQKLIRKKGCALCVASSLLTTYSDYPVLTPNSLDSILSSYYPTNSNMPWGQFGTALHYNVKAVNYTTAPDLTTLSSTLKTEVFTNHKRAILVYNEFIGTTAVGQHFVAVTGPVDNANPPTDWFVLDPGWNPVGKTNPERFYTIQGHAAGLNVDAGTPHTFVPAGLRLISATRS